MKALLLGPAYPIRGGIANFNESLAIAFIKNSIETEIVSFHKNYKTSLFTGKSGKSTDKPPYLLTIKQLVNPFDPLSWLRAARFISQEMPDIIIVQYWTPSMALAMGSILRLISKKHSPKIVAIVHNAIPAKKKFGNDWLATYFFNSCHGFVTLSRSVLEDLEKFTPNPNKIFIPHPVYDIFGDKIEKEEARKYLGINENEKVLLFFGIIRKYKGLELLLNSLAQDKLRRLNIKLLVAGEFFEGKHDLIAQAEKLGLRNNVVFADKFIPNDAVKYYFCAADMVVQPYIEATQSGVTQIAYNFERPMLVTNVGGLGEIVFDKHTGYVTEVNTDSIASAIIDFYEKNREESMSANVALEAYRFSWHAMVDAVLNLSENLK